MYQVNDKYFNTIEEAIRCSAKTNLPVYSVNKSILTLDQYLDYFYKDTYKYNILLINNYKNSISTKLFNLTDIVEFNSIEFDSTNTKKLIISRNLNSNLITRADLILYLEENHIFLYKCRAFNGFNKLCLSY